MSERLINYFFPLHVISIQKNPNDPTFFSNRAITRIKLGKWAEVEHDARAAIDLYGLKNPTALKSSYYLAQALLGLQRSQEAYDVAIDAYQLSLSSKNAQTENLSRTVLRAKQQIWAAKETSRLREMNETLKGIETLIEADLDRSVTELRKQVDAGELGEIGFGEDQKALREDSEKKIQDVREAFRIASNGEVKERVRYLSLQSLAWRASNINFVSQIVPDYLIDGITFEVMHDPVMTPSGSSFDRIGITKYVEKSGVDPITRVAMTVNDLRPNYALKAACEDFLDKNGWAVDY